MLNLKPSEIDIQFVNAVSRNALAEVKKLIDMGADIDAIDADENTALIYASVKGNVELVEMLLDAGAGTLPINNNGYTALMCAAHKGHIKIAMNLAVAVSRRGMKQSMLETFREQLKLTDMLAKAVSDRDMKNLMNMVSDKHYIKMRNFEIQYLEYGALDAMEAIVGWKVFMRGSVKRHAALAKALYAEACNVALSPRAPVVFYGPLRGDAAMTSLMCCTALKFCVEVPVILLTTDEKINLRNDCGMTALMCAAGEGKSELAKGLLYAYANPNAEDYHGRTALMCAARGGHVNVAKLLIDRTSLRLSEFSEGNSELESAVARIQVLEPQNVDVNVTDKFGRTALMLAVLNKHVELVEILLDAGAKVNTADVDGNTPFMLSISTGIIELVKILLDAGANVNAANKQGDTPLMWAVLGHVKIADMLLDMGVNVHAVNKRGYTALHLAQAAVDSPDDSCKILKRYLHKRLKHYFD